MCSGKLSPTYTASAVVYGSRSAEDAGWTAQLARRCQSHVRRRLETRCFRRQPGLFQYVYGALAAGASGFLLKHISPEYLTAAIRMVRSGDALLAPSITRRLVERFAFQTSAPALMRRELSHLTPRELDVLRLLARGMSNAEIAAQLTLSEATVKTHVARLLAKLQLRDRIQAVILAYATGLVSPGNDPLPS